MESTTETEEVVTPPIVEKVSNDENVDNVHVDEITLESAEEEHSTNAGEASVEVDGEAAEEEDAAANQEEDALLSEVDSVGAVKRTDEDADEGVETSDEDPVEEDPIEEGHEVIAEEIADEPIEETASAEAEAEASVEAVPTEEIAEATEEAAPAEEMIEKPVEADTPKEEYTPSEVSDDLSMEAGLDEAINESEKAPIETPVKVKETEPPKTPRTPRNRTPMRSKPTTPRAQAPAFDEVSLNTRARRATPNQAHLRLYEDGLRRLKDRNSIEEANNFNDEMSLNSRAKIATPNKAQLRLYSKRLP